MGGLETGFKLSAGTAGPAKNKGDCDVRSFIPRSRPRRKFEGILARKARFAIKTTGASRRLYELRAALFPQATTLRRP